MASMAWRYFFLQFFVLTALCGAIDNRPIDNRPIDNRPIDNRPIDNRPIIGILLERTSPGDTRGQYKMWADGRAFIEQAGGGVVPVFVNQTDDYYKNIMSRLNGIILPGGSVDLIKSPYGREAYHIYKTAMMMNDAGNYFPILGLCLGFQEMTTWPFNPQKNLTITLAGVEDVSLPLNFTKAASTSRLYGHMPSQIRNILGTKNVTPNLHQYGLPVKTYHAHKELQDFYSVTSVNVDANELEFVSSMEAYKYPFYGLQWHPEKINYFFMPGTRLNHSYEAVLVGQYVSNFFVSEARKSNQSFKSLAELSRFLVNNYPTTFSTNEFITMYFFKDNHVPKFDLND